MKIITNNKPRKLLFGYELTEKERSDFDYIDPNDLDFTDFIKYKNRVYDLNEFMRVTQDSPFYSEGWQGYSSESYFSGVLIKFPDNEGESVIVGGYYE